MTLRKTTSLTALLSFVALVFTSAFTYLAPRGPGSSDWTALGVGKHDWFALHTNLGALFVVACVVHLLLNIKPICAYLKNKDGAFRLFTMDFNIALALTAWIMLSSLFGWPPVDGIQRYKNELGNRGRHHPEIVAEKVEEPETLPERPPFLHGMKSLADLERKYADVDAVAIKLKLRDLGIMTDVDWSIKRIAKENDMTSAEVYDVIRQLN